MKALCWHGKSDIRYETVLDPKIQDPRDAILKVTACAICGSDLHIYNGVIPEMHKGDVIGQTGVSDPDLPAHLHFEVRTGGRDAVDPLKWLRSRR